MSLLNRAAAGLQKAPVVGKYYRNIGNAAGNYVTAKTDKEANQYRDKVMKPFKIAGGAVITLGAAPAALAGRGALSAAARGGSGLVRTGAKKAASRATSTLSRAARAHAKTTAGLGALAAGGTSVTYFFQKNKEKGDKEKSAQQQAQSQQTKSTSHFQNIGLPDRNGLSMREYANKYGSDAAKSYKHRRDSQRVQEQMAMIGQSWNDVMPEYDRIYNNILSGRQNAGKTVRKLRDDWLTAINEDTRQQDVQITNQENLLRRQQRKELTGIARDANKAQFSATLGLGAHGAADSSAALMAARGIRQSAEKNRRQILQRVSQEVAKLEQQRRAARINAERQRQRVYQMEQDFKAQLIAQFDEAMRSLKRLKKRAPKWRQRDLKNEEDAYLARFTQELQTAADLARQKRDEIHAKQAEIDTAIDDMKLQAALTFAPPELEAQDVETLTDLFGDETTDYFDPTPNQKKKKGKKKVQSVLDPENNDPAGLFAESL